MNARILDYSYDAYSHKTYAYVETQEFTQWLSVSGYVKRSEMLRWLEPTINAYNAEFAA